MEALPPELLERIMTAADQPSRLACRSVSKTFLKSSKNPRVWTSLHIRSPGPRASQFLKECTSCVRVDMTTSEDPGPFLSETYPASIHTLCMYIDVPNVHEHLVQHIMHAFPGLENLTLSVGGLASPSTMSLPDDLALNYFEFEDADMVIELRCGCYDIANFLLKVDSTDAHHHVDELWTSSSGLANFQGTCGIAMVDLDTDYVFDTRVDTQYLQINLNGKNVFVPYGIFDGIPEVAFDECDDSKIVFYDVYDVQTFFRQETHLKIPPGAHVELRPFDV
jgi:hypothetical protein